MATGYVNYILENDLDFEGTAKVFARAFMYSLRDEPISTDLPESVEDSSYVSMMEEAEAKLAELEAMTDCSSQLAFGNEVKTSRLNYYTETVEKTKKNLALMQERLKQFEAWEVPDSLKSLRHLAIEQLKSSIEFENLEHQETQLASIESQHPSDFYFEALKDAKKSVERYRELREREVENNAKNNEWLATLYDNLSDPLAETESEETFADMLNRNVKSIAKAVSEGDNTYVAKKFKRTLEIIREKNELTDLEDFALRKVEGFFEDLL